MATFNNIGIDLSNMLPSNITLEIVKKYLNIEQEYIEDDVIIGLCVVGAVDYVCNHSSRTREELDLYPFMVIPILKIVSDSYFNKGVIDRKSSDVLLDRYLYMISDINV